MHQQLDQIIEKCLAKDGGEEIEPVGEEPPQAIDGENSQTETTLGELRKWEEGLEQLRKYLSKDHLSPAKRKYLKERLAQLENKYRDQFGEEPPRETAVDSRPSPHAALQAAADRKHAGDFARDAARTREYGDRATGLPVSDDRRTAMNALLQAAADKRHDEGGA